MMLHRRSALALLLPLVWACGNNDPPLPANPPPTVSVARRNVLETKAMELVGMMSEAELVGQILMVGVDGRAGLSPASKLALAAMRPGAVLLFGFNIDPDPRIVSVLADDIRLAASAGTLPPFVAVDHEGGSVYRFKGGLTRLPAAAIMGFFTTDTKSSTNDKTAVDYALRLAKAAGTAAGTELRALGITMNLAPVVEALTDENRAFLVDRAWSDSPDICGQLSAAFIEACQSGGAAAVAKHFPGNAAADPHRGLPFLGVSKERLQGFYYPPFRDAIRSGVSAVMLSHAVVGSLDPDVPASISKRVITELKGRLGFTGIVMTDDLAMAALAGYGSPGECAVLAVEAGADMLMASGGKVASEIRAALVQALADGRIGKPRLVDAAYRIVLQKLGYGLASETEADRAGRLDGITELVRKNSEALSALLADRR